MGVLLLNAFLRGKTKKDSRKSGARGAYARNPCESHKTINCTYSKSSREELMRLVTTTIRTGF